jgi:hypothetical protein
VITFQSIPRFRDGSAIILAGEGSNLEGGKPWSWLGEREVILMNPPGIKAAVGLTDLAEQLNAVLEWAPDDGVDRRARH